LVFAGAIAVGFVTLPRASVGQEWPVFKSQQSELQSRELRAKPRRPATEGQKAKPRGAVVLKKAPEPPVHKLAIQVDENSPQIMNLALNNARNVLDYYSSKGEKVAIEVVTFGPGLHMLRDDTSPVKQRISAMALETPGITFIACANTQANMSKQEGTQIGLISEAKLMPSGVVRLMELQGSGYAYVRP
jgi:uncharacterized protein